MRTPSGSAILGRPSQRPHGGGPLSYIEKSLIGGERVLYRARLHWIVLLWPALIAGCVGLIGVGFLAAGVVPSLRPHGTAGAMGILGLLLFLTALGLLVAGIIKRNATEIAVTNRRVLIKTGVINRRTVELLLVKIESIGVEEAPLGRMLGFGTVIVRGTGGTPERFERISDPLEFRRQVQTQVEGLTATAAR